ncbi:phosphatidate cytidylyltransferase [Celeribacter marinus]|uniref:phosphatidate cytidylyltransferase n=1 Tax=Celeribacter marinus TaxID=1397108 RepID=UPI003F6B4206
MNLIHEKWGDLGVRVASAAVMLMVGVVAIAAGSLVFGALVCAVSLIGIWELVHMGRAKSAKGIFSFADFFALSGYAFFVCLAAVGLIFLYVGFSAYGVGYLVALVVVTDSLGYLVGRKVGGKKFWPSISPKKTWAGVLGGWGGVAVLALVVGTVAPISNMTSTGFVLFSVAMSFASQLGDIAQSALKRRMGVKDSSNIIPGHGGVLDRFDALLAASVVMLGCILYAI